MALIVDHLGRPINQSELRRDDRIARVGSAATRHQSATVALRLSAERLGDVLHRASIGDFADFMQICKDIEKRWLHYRAVLTQRKTGVTSIVPRVEAASDSARDVEIADALAAEIKLSKWNVCIRDLLDGLAKGFSVTEMTWEYGEKASPRLRWRDQRDFQYDRDTFSVLRKRVIGGMDGEELTPGKFMIHEPKLVSGFPLDGALGHPIAIYYLIHSFALKDWTAFAEVFGFPIRYGEYPEGSTEEQIAELLDAVKRIGTDAAAVIHEGMNMHFEGAVNASGGGDLFAALARYCNAECSKGVVGQTLTTQEGSVGSLALGTVMERVASRVSEADAQSVQATINDQFCRLWVDLNYGPQKKYPRFVLEEEEKEDLKALGEFIWQAVDRGVEIEQSWVRDKIGAPEPTAGAKILKPKTTGTPDQEPQEPQEPAQQ